MSGGPPARADRHGTRSIPPWSLEAEVVAGFDWQHLDALFTGCAPLALGTVKFAPFVRVLGIARA
jgi:hypothetical protein